MCLCRVPLLVADACRTPAGNCVEPGQGPQRAGPAMGLSGDSRPHAVAPVQGREKDGPGEGWKQEHLPREGERCVVC